MLSEFGGEQPAGGLLAAKTNEENYFLIFKNTEKI
jgi:hypothetical protein